MILIPLTLLIILIHWFADFVCQTNDMAVNKSKSNSYLTAHVAVYTLVTLLAWHFLILRPTENYHFEDYYCFIFFIFTTHWITDYVTSRVTAKYFNKNDYHNGFVVIGLDQLLHYVQLLTAYYLIVK